jgi:hypothetical protein
MAMDGVFTGASDRAALATAYPLSAARFSHILAGHPLLTLDALADAALALPPENVERRCSDGDYGSTFTKLDNNLPPIDVHIRAIEAQPCWIMLARIQQLPAYRALVDMVVEAARATIEAATGPIRDPVGFIFISAKGSVTPFHFDPEYNLFFQVAGSKRFATFAAEPPVLTESVNEGYHHGGDNMLAWNDELAEAATVHALAPGDGLFVPYKAPHWIEVEAGLSISLSVTWKSDWCEQQLYGHRFNARLRGWGMVPGALPQWPGRAAPKAVAERLLGRLGLAS